LKKYSYKGITENKGRSPERERKEKDNS